MKKEARILSVAPMVQWTDRHWRYFMRGITKETLLYTEMTLGDALAFNPTKLESFIGHDPIEEPLAIQLGGCNPTRLGEAAYLCESFGNFHEINLNAGCPSNKAKRCGYGAELMLDPDLITRILCEMKRRVTHTEITIKCRIGVTGKDSWSDLLNLVHHVEAAGVKSMIIHARTCVLRGLSCAQNRTIPPLHPEKLHQLVNLFPDMKFILNGGITSFTQAQSHLTAPYYHPSYESGLPAVHGVMIGREAYHHPLAFLTADDTFYSSQPNHIEDVTDAAENAVDTGKDIDYLDLTMQHHAEQPEGVHYLSICHVMKPLHNLFHHCQYNHVYKQKLDKLLIDYCVQRKKEQEGGYVAGTVASCVGNSSVASSDSQQLGLRGLLEQLVEETFVKEDLLARQMIPRSYQEGKGDKEEEDELDGADSCPVTVS